MEFSLNDISVASPCEIKVINSVGIPVYKQSGNVADRFLLDKASVGSRLFILRIKSGRQVYSEKFIFEYSFEIRKYPWGHVNF